jgi:hypothetical protein
VFVTAERNGEMKKRKSRAGRRGKEKHECCCCRRTFTFCWWCPCGFEICQECMEENLWGMTCNNIYWTCPDCGAIRQY